MGTFGGWVGSGGSCLTSKGVSIEGWRTTAAVPEMFEHERIGAKRQIGTRGAT
jgi:hypothetical protein